ncbi:bacterio-opsin activator HTH domain-containing protein [Natrialba taiwanensis DSM 12281]|uniref:Bacterio-opsin activator HTH domain-containing protein n=1 Tax=Natrialba taiwanensis DSM 12281 TaxID=1230458 RepID=L9ZFQ0_9EURY|nr:bacterio-opsin activator HTH domain-containing protein [Natrialba taiwanensis DSM 12281]
MQAAVEYGYYETPRQIDLSELADRLDVPRSTLSYRLRRAEATLASTFVGEMETIELAAGL